MQDMLFRADLNEAILGIAAFVILLLGFMLQARGYARSYLGHHAVPVFRCFGGSLLGCGFHNARSIANP